LVGVRWTRRVRNQALRISLWIRVCLGVFALQTENAPRIGVRDIFWVGPFPFSGLVGFRRLFLLACSSIHILKSLSERQYFSNSSYRR
jgi:hypothetical protein